eukprot:COSAG01_NODE_64107_length_277_cov_2.202247_1_plen_52_part_10
MADLTHPELRQWIAEVREDHNPTTWVTFGYSGKTTIVPQTKGGGEAEDYWPS